MSRILAFSHVKGSGERKKESMTSCRTRAIDINIKTM